MLHWFSSSIVPMSWLRYSSPLLCKRKPHSMPLVLTHTSLLASLPLASNPDITWSLLITSAGGNDVDPVERKQQIGLCLASRIGVQSTRTSAHTHAHGENYPPMLSKLGLWKHTLLISRDQKQVSSACTGSYAAFCCLPQRAREDGVSLVLPHRNTRSVPGYFSVASHGYVTLSQSRGLMM